MDIAVRWARDADAAAVDGLAADAASEARSKRDGPLLVEGQRRKASGRAAVVTLDGVIVGYATARLLTLASGSRLCRVDALYVEKGARGVGAGEALADFVIGFARTEECLGVDVAALPGDRETKNFLEGSGFSARLLVMHRSLEEA